MNLLLSDSLSARVVQLHPAAPDTIHCASGIAEKRDGGPERRVLWKRSGMVNARAKAAYGPGWWFESTRFHILRGHPWRDGAPGAGSTGDRQGLRVEDSRMGFRKSMNEAPQAARCNCGLAD